VLDAVSEGAAIAGAIVTVAALAGGEESIDAALASAEMAEAFILGSPVYSASFSAPLKTFIDRLPRGMWGETEQPLTARAVSIVLTGATWHHYLALDGLRGVLAGFFGAHVLSPGLYVPCEGFGDGDGLTEEVEAQAQAQGAQLVALARAVAASPPLHAIRPQA
jgi:FMN reductase